MSRKWVQDGDDLRETSNGSVRVGYDADDQEYLWRRPDGAILKGPEYGPLRLYRSPNSDLVSIQGYFNRPIVPCPCCDKDLRPSDKAPCDCGELRCPIAATETPNGMCVKHCDLPTHFHWDRHGNMIPLDELVSRKPVENAMEMLRQGLIPEAVIAAHPEFFRESTAKKMLKSIKGFFKVKK